MSCTLCDDVGVLRIDHEGSGTLVLCDCPEGDKQVWALPRLKTLTASRTQPLKHQDFKPSRLPMGQDTLNLAMKEKIAWWRAKVRHAETYWKSHEQELQRKELVND
jgi:hypothetical protein